MDAYLTQNPQVTRFKPRYDRHTDFKVVEETLQVQPIGENTYEATFSENTHIHLLNQIVLHHPDPNLNLEKCLETIEVIGRTTDDYEYTFCTASAKQILFDASLKEKMRFPFISRDESGICIRPYFFFCEPQKSLPLISMSKMKAYFRIACRVPFNIEVWGFRLTDEDEKKTL